MSDSIKAETTADPKYAGRTTTRFVATGKPIEDFATNVALCERLGGVKVTLTLAEASALLAELERVKGEREAMQPLVDAALRCRRAHMVNPNTMIWHGDQPSSCTQEKMNASSALQKAIMEFPPDLALALGAAKAGDAQKETPPSGEVR